MTGSQRSNRRSTPPILPSSLSPQISSPPNSSMTKKSRVCSHAAKRKACVSSRSSSNPARGLRSNGSRQFRRDRKDGRALSAGNEYQIDTDLAALAEEIAKIIKRAGISNNVGATHRVAPHRCRLTKSPLQNFHPLPPDLFGREKELKELDDAWNNPRHQRDELSSRGAEWARVHWSTNG